MARITVEDCLAAEPNRFVLVRMTTIRAKEILNGAPVLSEVKGNKAIVTALREIAAKRVRKSIKSIDANSISVEKSVAAFLSKNASESKKDLQN